MITLYRKVIKMQEEQGLLEIYIGFLGGFIAAAIGALARNVYHPEGLSPMRLLMDLPFIALVSIAAGGLGSWLDLPPQAVYALSGTAAYLSSQFVTQLVKAWALRKLGGKNENGRKADAKNN